jgi:type III restriction enzyme
MDKGNHYKKCDLQVHTPRDINWKNGPKISDLDRKDYAEKFIKECRVAELDAIAITDHHDMVFFEYVKQASIDELNSNGEPIPAEKKIIIFPGVELTLHSPPIQGLLIFDADFPINLFPTALGALSLAQAPKSDSKTSITQPIPSGTINSINDIYSKLDGTDGVKGRYVFFPHVKDKGHRTLMRTGFHEAYSKMPCGGGYVDGKLEESGVGYNNIVAGKVDAYGFKSIALIQTSDYRGGKTISEYDVATWIKMKEPTAEALRQACLAKESRISLKSPELPNIFIEKIDVTNSVFLSKFDLDFNPQLNSIIGGRGSGKSTILEYLRWALCDQTETFGNDDFKSEIERKRNTLIEKTLKEVDGEVRIFFNVNGTRHIIKRNPKQEDVLLKIGDEDFQSVRPKQISDLLPVQAYSQKQLSSISIQPKELKRFIEQPISQEIEEIDSKILEAANKVRKTYEDLARSKSMKSDIKRNELESNSFKQQIEKLKGGLKGISETDKKVIERAKFFVNEKNRFDEIEIEYETIKTQLNTLKDLTKKFNSIQTITETDNYENKVIIEKLDNERQRFIKVIASKIEEIEAEFIQSKSAISTYGKEWQIIRSAFVIDYKKAKEQSSSSQTTLTAIKNLEEKLEKLELIIRQKKVDLSSLNITEDNFKEVFQIYIDLQSSKTKKLKDSTELFTKLSDGLIKVDFTKIINDNHLNEILNQTFSSYKDRCKVKSTK